MMNIEESSWAKSFKVDAPVSYKEALRIALDPALEVDLIENDDAGFWQWSIDAGEVRPGFWMDAFPSLEEAQELCDVMSWKVGAIVHRPRQGQ